jgi:hypothetical protein
MASKSASIERLLVQDVFVKTPNNQNISTQYILISDGAGGTYWNSVSSILPISSFKTVVGNDGVSSFSADMMYNTLLVSTTAIPSTFNSYVDPTTSSLMLSLNFPPIVINGGSVPQITNTFQVPNPNTISSATLQSTIKFYGVNDIIFSTVNAQRAVYLGISTFTAPGYSTIYGEMQNNPKVSVSSFSTSVASPQSASFVSSIPFTIAGGGTMSTSGTALYTSSIQFDAGHLAQYINMTNRKTRISFEYYPNYVLPPMGNESENINAMSSIKKVTSYIQGASGFVFGETSNVRYITSQNISTSTYPRSMSNVFTDTIRMDISSYQLSTSLGLVPNLTLSMYHRIDNSYNNSPGNVTFAGTTYLNNTLSTNGLYLHVNNEPDVPTATVPPSYPSYF